jgi:tetratricopeptide (TPR) repeat protein
MRISFWASFGLAIFLTTSIASAQEERALEYRLKGVQLAQNGELDKAAQYFKKSIQVEPSYPAPYNDLGITLERLGKDVEAEKAYQNALKADQYYAPAHSNLARFYEKHRRFHLALQAWQHRSQLGPMSDPGRQEAFQRVAHLKRMIPAPSASSGALAGRTPPELEDERAQELAQLFVQERR